jgi:hypothetical protein
MNLLFWLDIPLILIGFLAISPWLWHSVRRQQARRPFRGRGVRMTATVLFCLGVATIGSAGIDAGLAYREEARRAGRVADIRVTMMAPDFHLSSLDEERMVRLSEYRGQKPVVLIFGNFY